MLDAVLRREALKAQEQEQEHEHERTFPRALSLVFFGSVFERLLFITNIFSPFFAVVLLRFAHSSHACGTGGYVAGAMMSVVKAKDTRMQDMASRLR